MESLKTARLTQIDRKKASWDAQIRADQERQNKLDAQNAETRQQVQTNNDTGGARKKPKLGAFATTVGIGKEITLKPSTFAITKLKIHRIHRTLLLLPSGLLQSREPEAINSRRSLHLPLWHRTRLFGRHLHQPQTRFGTSTPGEDHP